MSTVDLSQQIGAARAYDGLFVPALFEQWASRVADAAQIAPGDRVLDVACGTGVLAREALSRVGEHGRVAGVDANPGMLAVASERAPAVEWHHGFAESLPLPDSSFDVVVCQFGLMFFLDRVRALTEMVRVLVPGGRMALAVWDRLENMPAFAAETAVLERLGGAPAADALRAPFVLGDSSELAALCRDAGALILSVATRDGVAEFPNVRTMVEADLRGWLPLMGVHLSEPQIERIIEEAGRALGSHVAADGRTRFGIRAHIVTAARPAR